MAKDDLRLDQALVNNGHAETLSKAQSLIMAGLVFSGTQRLDKPGLKIKADQPLTVKGQEHPWVSRGGLKLAAALQHFNINISGHICLDIGASTGGFTDVLLTHGAVKVYAVDVGQGQLAWRLRQDPRVVILEKTNARYLDRNLIPQAPNIIVCDASFISLKTVLPAALSLAAKGAVLIALIKPQFEADPADVEKGGVVRDPAIHQAICDDISAWLSSKLHWNVLGVITSPLLGPEGNKEFLIAARFE